MKDDNKIPPAGLHPHLVKALLDNLESNHDFRTAFAESPEKALRSIGYADPWACMTLKAGTKLASPEQIKAQRAKLEATLVGIQSYDCALADQQGV